MRAGRGRVWRVGKWAGVVACAAILVVWALSSRWGAMYVWANFRVVSISNGKIMVMSRMKGPPLEVSRRLQAVSLMGTQSTRGTAFGWRFGRPKTSSTLESFGLGLPVVRNLQQGAGVTSTYGELPCWLLLLSFAVPTAMVWYSDWRRIPVGHCGRYGYDLTRNESGRCPECGVEIERVEEKEAEPSAAPPGRSIC